MLKELVPACLPPACLPARHHLLVQGGQGVVQRRLHLCRGLPVSHTVQVQVGGVGGSGWVGAHAPRVWQQAAAAISKGRARPCHSLAVCDLICLPCLHTPPPACSVAIDQLCVHECHIIGKGGMYWPQPTFKVSKRAGGEESSWGWDLMLGKVALADHSRQAGRQAGRGHTAGGCTRQSPAALPCPALLQVVALDRPDEPLIAKSCTGCWTGVSTPSQLPQRLSACCGGAAAAAACRRCGNRVAARHPGVLPTPNSHPPACPACLPACRS